MAHSGYGKGEERGWRGLVESADLEYGRVILIFEGPDRRNALPLLWQSVEGPKEYATKQVAAKPKTVPVVVRSEKDCLSPFTLPAGVARVMDQSIFIHQRACTDLEPGSYQDEVASSIKSYRTLGLNPCVRPKGRTAASPPVE